MSIKGKEGVDVHDISVGGKKYHDVGKRNNGLLEQFQCSIFC